MEQISFDCVITTQGECQFPLRFREAACSDIDILKVANKIEKALQMHDRLIVATALYYNAPLITKDRLVTQSQLCPILW
jgi:PIN domain nuclease of toxin-antitoxin system